MRKTLVSLIALATATAVSASAFAQDAAPATTVTTTTSSETTTTAPANPAVPATTVVTPPATVVTTTPAPAGAVDTTTTTTATTVTTTAPPAAPVVEVPPPPPPPPPPPTDPMTIQTLNVLENVCKPLVTGGDLATIAKPLGFKKNRDNSWTLRLDKPYQITVLPPGVNRNVCNMEILHPVNNDAPLTVGVHNYAIQRGYTLYRNDEYTTDLKRHTRSWELAGEGHTEALVLVTEKNPDGSPVVKNADRTTLMYSLTPTQ